MKSTVGSLAGHPAPRMRPVAVLLVWVALTAVVGFAYRGATLDRDRIRFETLVRGTEDQISARLDTHVAMLLATRGLLVASEVVTADEFRRFVDEVGIGDRYPGVQGIGFTRRFAWADVGRVEEELRALGQEAFSVWPRTPREEGHAIVFLEPMDRRNEVAIGYDMFTDPIRRDAMERARDSGQPAASGPVTVVQEIDHDKQAGFLVYVPVYEGGAAPGSLEERRERLSGFVYAPFRMGDLLAHIFGSERDPRVAFTLSDEGDGGPVEVYRSGGFDGTGRLSAVAALPVAGRRWILAFESTSAFERGSSTWLTPYVFAIGAVLSGVFYALSLRQRRTDEQLRLHSRILSSMSEGVSVTDERGVILYTNPAEDRMFGYEPGELVGRHVSALNAAPAAESRRLVDEVVRVLGEEGSWSGGFENVRKDGTRFVTAARIFGLEVKRQQCWVCVQEDITDRNRAEREREDLLERERASRAVAEEANRVKDEFLAMLGHELRNPLAPIVTALDLLRRRGLEQEPAFAVVVRQVRYLRRLVDDLLDVSRITRGRVALDKRRIDVATIVEDAVETVHPLLEQRRHALEVHVAPDLAVDGDRGRLVQVVGNLLSNAAKYTDPGGRISVGAARDGAEVVLTVRDDGIGIPPHLMPRLFDLFTQGARAPDRSDGGLGIGLAVARGLVDLHGGRIVARSDGPGRGSEFEVRLPAAIATAEPAAVKARSERVARAAQGLRVLVVDDNADAAATLADLLTEAGHEVEIAHDAPEALDRCSRRSPEVAILDIGLPVMDGYELAARLPDPKPTLFALTGYGSERDRVRSRSAGFAHHFAKPADPDELLEALSDVARRRSAPRPADAPATG